MAARRKGAATDRPSGQKGTRDRVFMGVVRIYRSGKRVVFSKTRLGYERFKQFFLLPGCYRKVRAIKDCTRSGTGVALDLLTWFFSYKTLPVHYAMSRLWEVDRDDWKYYYGSNYLPHQLARLKRTVQPLEYRVLFNDKYICALLCQALGIRIPLTHGVLDPAHDYRSQIAAWLASSPAGKLIIKPLYGEMGRDIVLAEPAEEMILIVSPQGPVPLDDFVLKEKAIVQDVLSQEPRMAAFSPSSVNTLRVVTMLTPQDQAIIVNASFRTGVGNAIVDNFSAGGVSAGIDCIKGSLTEFAYDKESHRYTVHPTSGIVFKDHPVPEWDRVREAAVGIQRAFSFYRLIGLDMALDKNGDPVLIEANGAPDLAGLEQKAGPLLKSERVLRAFGEYDLLFNRHQRSLYAALLLSDRASDRNKPAAQISS
jgi:hypothetical protein